MVTITLVCDSCGAKADNMRGTVTEVRWAMQPNGWHNPSRGRDLCQACAKDRAERRALARADRQPGTDYL